MSEKTSLIQLLQEIVNGLVRQGYKEQGGSEVYRILEYNNNTQIRLFLNNYDEPTHIIIRYSSYPVKGE